jgi:hypothetical protein
LLDLASYNHGHPSREIRGGCCKYPLLAPSDSDRRYDFVVVGSGRHFGCPLSRYSPSGWTPGHHYYSTDWGRFGFGTPNPPTPVVTTPPPDPYGWWDPHSSDGILVAAVFPVQWTHPMPSCLGWCVHCVQVLDRYCGRAVMYLNSRADRDGCSFLPAYLPPTYLCSCYSIQLCLTAFWHSSQPPSCSSDSSHSAHLRRHPKEDSSSPVPVPHLPTSSIPLPIPVCQHWTPSCLHHGRVPPLWLSARSSIAGQVRCWAFQVLRLPPFHLTCNHPGQLGPVSINVTS